MAKMKRLYQELQDSPKSKANMPVETYEDDGLLPDFEELDYLPEDDIEDEIDVFQGEDYNNKHGI